MPDIRPPPLPRGFPRGTFQLSAPDDIGLHCMVIRGLWGRPEGRGAVGSWLLFDEPPRTGDFGRRASISELCGTTGFPPCDSCLTWASQGSRFHFSGGAASPEPVSTSIASSSTLSSSPSARTETQPRRSVLARPNSSSRRIPRQKFSIRVYISGGFNVGSVGSPSQIMTSVSRKKGLSKIRSEILWVWMNTHRYCNVQTSCQ